MARLRIACTLLLLTATLSAQTPPSSRYRMVTAKLAERLPLTVNQVAAEAGHYRVRLYTPYAALMERTEAPEPFRYVGIWDNSIADQIRQQLNTHGARGYRVLRAPGRPVSQAQLLLEKPPGRPNQFQYVLEMAHRIAMGKFGLPRDDFSAAPSLIAGRAREGYSFAALLGRIMVFEKPAEPTGEPAPCADLACYQLRDVKSSKHFDEALHEAGHDGLRFWAASAVVVWMREGRNKSYEYRTIPVRLDRLALPLESAAQEGFCVRADLGKFLLLERGAGRRCRYRLLHGAAQNIERDLDQAAADGFVPVLLHPEGHAGKGNLPYVVLAEKVEVTP